MQDICTVTGLILKEEPFGEYDRRVVILTRERSKIAAFATGARRQGSRLLAATNPFCFGEFKLFEGRNSYRISEANISNYFAYFREDIEAAYYGMYFLEVMDYYTRENNDEKEMLKLLYQSLRALCHEKLDNRLVRCIFEIKALALNGEYPGTLEKNPYQEATIYTLSYIVNSPVEKLYSFVVKENVLLELQDISGGFQKRFIDRKFKSLEFLDVFS